MKITDRKTGNCNSDYCMEWDNGTYIWIENNRIVDSNDMLEPEQVNDMITHILSDYEYKHECV